MVLIEQKDVSKQHVSRSVDILEYVDNLSLLQKFKLHFFGHVKVDLLLEGNQDVILSYYVFRCREHGLQLSYLMGHRGLLMCPVCLVV